MPVDIKVRNFLGIEYADIMGLDAIALIAGRNFQGKTSLLESVAGVLCNEPMMRSIRLKRELQELVRDGSEQGQAYIRIGDNAGRLTWPSCEYESEGVPPTARLLACGARNLSGLSVEHRRLELISILEAMPSKEDVERFLSDHPGIPKNQLAGVIETVWTTIDTNGWDPYAKELHEKGTKLKGRWEEITGTKFGPKKAREWTPEGWTEDLAAAEEKDLDHNVHTARALLNQKIAEAGTDMGRIEQLRKTADRIPELQENLKKLETAKGKFEAQIEKRVKELAELPPWHRFEPKPCPKCKTPLVPAWSVNLPGQNVFVSADEYDLVEAESYTRDKKKLAERTAARDKIQLEIDKIRREVNDINSDMIRNQTELTSAEKAQKDLEKIETSQVTQEDVDHAQQRLREHERVIALWRAKAKADHIFAILKINVAAQACVKQEGVRHTVLKRKLDAFNEQMADLIEHGGFRRRVEIDMDLEIRLGGRRYTLLSGSEKMLCDVAITIALGQVTGAPLLLIDELETLEQHWRPVVMKMLRYAAIPALVVVMAPDQQAVPDMKRFKLGRNFWLENGRMEEMFVDAA